MVMKNLLKRIILQMEWHFDIQLHMHETSLVDALYYVELKTRVDGKLANVIISLSRIDCHHCTENETKQKLSQLQNILFFKRQMQNVEIILP